MKKIIQNIKALKVQGARNVARAALRAMGEHIRRSRAKNLDALYAELLVLRDALAHSRPTEPMMRNLLEDVVRYAFAVLKKDGRSLREAKQLILDREDTLLDDMQKSIDRVAEHGAAMLTDGMRVVTHCHSSSVTAILRRAKEDGKELDVAVCETRPRYQGHLTATELVQSHIRVSLFVDGAMNLIMKDADIVLVGADSVTARGDLINKVGTSTLAHIARFHDVSFYSAAELYKYSPLTFFGQREQIEERDPREVWSRAPRGVRVRNPAFDVTAARYINGYITDAGVIPPQAIFAIAHERFRPNV